MDSFLTAGALLNHLLFFASPGDIFRDTSIYLVPGIFLGLMHFLIWCVARHTADIKFWRIGVF